MDPEETRTAAVEAAAEPRTGRGILVALLSLMFPGAGQLAVGARRRGLVMVGITVLLLIAAWQGVQDPESVLEMLVRPGGLAELLAGNVALAGFRIYATLDAFRIGAGGLQRSMSEQVVSLGALGAIAGLATVALAPHAVAAHYTLVTDGMLRGVFAESQASGERDDGTGASGSTHTAQGRTSWSGTASQDRDGVQTVDGVASLADRDRITVAVLGSDAAPGRPGDRLDALLVVSVDPQTGQVAVFSVERHLRHFPLPDGLKTPWEQRCRDAAPGWDLLNALYRCGDEVATGAVAELYPTAPDPAAAAVADTLGLMLGLSVDHYVMVDMAGFVELVDALGGIDLELAGPPRLHEDGTGCDWRAFDVTPESDHLDGAAALELVRNRDGTYESDRMARQRCLLVTLAGQVDAASLLGRFGQLVGLLREHLETSIPLNELPEMIKLLSYIDLDEVVTVGFGQPDYVVAGDRPHLERIRDEVERTLAGPSSPTARARSPR